MTFHRVADLPQRIRDELPEQAQELYFAAYNQTWEAENAAATGDIDEQMLAELAEKGAWLQVNKEYVQDEHGRWRPHAVDDDIDKDDIRDTT